VWTLISPKYEVPRLGELASWIFLFFYISTIPLQLLLPK
jgi:hypothetical protein